MRSAQNWFLHQWFCSWPNELVKSVHVMQTCETTIRINFVGQSGNDSMEFSKYHLSTYTPLLRVHTRGKKKFECFICIADIHVEGPCEIVKRGFQWRKKASIIIKFDVVHDRNTNCIRALLFFANMIFEFIELAMNVECATEIQCSTWKMFDECFQYTLCHYFSSLKQVLPYCV